MGLPLKNAGRLGQLHHDIAALLRHSLGSAPDYDITDQDFGSLHIDYTAWRMRVPTWFPRTTYVSREIQRSDLGGKFATQWKEVVRELEAGVDLTPRLSTSVVYPPMRMGPIMETGNARKAEKRRRARGLDRLLSTTGYHHLHLGSASDSTGFVDRTDAVLLVALRHDAAYLIDVVGHERDGANWSASALVEIPARNWPDAGIVLPLPVGATLTREWNDEERRELIRGGVTPGPVMVDGRPWNPMTYQSGAGLPTEATRVANATAWLLNGHNESEARVRGMTGGPDEAWYALVHNETFGFIDPTLKRWVAVGSLVP